MMFNILKNTLRSSLIYGVGTISSKLIGFVLIPLYTSYLSTSDFGVLAIVEITTVFLTTVISLKINAAFFRWYWDKEYISRQKSIFFTSIIALVLFGIFILSIFWSYSEQISILIFDTSKYSRLILLMYISAGLQIIIDLVLYLMRLQDKAFFYSAISIIKLIIALVLIIVFVTAFNKGIEGIYEAIIISQIVFILLSVKYIYTNSRLKLEPNIFWGMMKFSLPLIVAELSGVILTISDRYCLNFLSSSSEVGIYSLGFKISNTIRVFIYSSVMLAVAPIIYKYIDHPDNKRFYSKLLIYFSFGAMWATIAVAIFSENIIHLFAKDKSYWGSITLIPVISFAILFGIIKDVSLTGLNITKKTSIIAIVVFILATLNIILNFAFIPKFGSMGAAYATLITRILSFIIFYKIAQHYYLIPYEIKKIFQILIVGILLFGISKLFFVNNIYLTLLIKSMLIISFPFLLYYLKFYEKVELEKISQFCQKIKLLKSLMQYFK